jgi:CHAT domain-containing protein
VGEAARFYQQALDAFEKQTTLRGGSPDVRMAYRADYTRYYREYIDVLMTLHQPDAAFHTAERFRARSLLQMLGEARIDLPKDANPLLLGEQQVLEQSLRTQSDLRIRLLTGEHTPLQVQEVEQEIEHLSDQLRDLESQIRAASPNYLALTQPQPLDVGEVQQILDDQTILLEYILGDERSYVWAVSRNSLRGYTLPARHKIENRALQLYKLISKPPFPSEGGDESRGLEPWKIRAARLSRMLLGPLGQEIAGKRIVIVKDGALHYVPFEALPVPGSSSLLPLINKHEVVYVPSAAVVAELRQEAATRVHALKGVAVLADPVFDKDDPRVNAAATTVDHQPAADAAEDASINERLTRSVADIGLAHLPRLAFTHREADAIMAVTPPGQGKKIVGFAADRAAATSPDLSQYRIIHFATHALSDNVHPELSGLVFSLVDPEGRLQDGFLDLERIYNLKLPVDLVVLSACESGLGKEISGEGLVGLTRGFMYAGATRVVASVWNADDASTKELMQRFYTSMLLQRATPAAALRQAQISMWKQKRWNSPYYWAAFQLQGEWK